MLKPIKVNQKENNISSFNSSILFVPPPLLATQDLEGKSLIYCSTFAQNLTCGHELWAWTERRVPIDAGPQSLYPQRTAKKLRHPRGILSRAQSPWGSVSGTSWGNPTMGTGHTGGEYISCLVLEHLAVLPEELGEVSGERMDKDYNLKWL